MDPELKEHVIGVFRSASIDSATGDSLQTALNKEERQYSLLDVQQACAELVEEGRLRRLDAEKVTVENLLTFRSLVEGFDEVVVVASVSIERVLSDLFGSIGVVPLPVNDSLHRKPAKSPGRYKPLSSEPTNSDASPRQSLESRLTARTHD